MVAIKAMVSGLRRHRVAYQVTQPVDDFQDNDVTFRPPCGSGSLYSQGRGVTEQAISRERSA
jgi:hypothetical protein